MPGDEACVSCGTPLHLGAIPLRDKHCCAIAIAALEAVETRPIRARRRSIADQSAPMRATSGELGPPPRLCPTCRRILAPTEAVMFQGDRLVHAACRSNPSPLRRPCAGCGENIPLEEPANFDGAATYHLPCWPARSRTQQTATNPPGPLRAQRDVGGAGTTTMS